MSSKWFLDHLSSFSLHILSIKFQLFIRQISYLLSLLLSSLLFSSFLFYFLSLITSLNLSLLIHPSFSFFLFHLPLPNCFFQSSLSTLSGINFMQMAALLVSSVSVVTKEALYHYTLKVGNGSNSDSVSTTSKRTTVCDW